MCAGAIDGTHIPISTPQQSHASYINRKSYHSIVMQALVDSNYLLRDFVVGWPGSVHDAQVISNSQLYALGCSGRLYLPGVKEEALGQEIHPVILADPAYPLLNLVLKGEPRPQGLLLDNFQNGGSSGESPGKGWARDNKIN